VSKYLSAIVGWEAPNVTQDMPDDLQETPDVTQETPDDLQETPNVPQETPENLQETPTSSRKTSTTGRASAKSGRLTSKWQSYRGGTCLLTRCKRSSDKDPSKPSRSALLQLLLKYMVAAGKLIVDQINEEGVQILCRGDTTHVTGDVAADVTLAPARETHLTFESQLQSQTQRQPC
jgi:hypothetical protein